MSSYFTCFFILRRLYIMLQGYDIYTLHFMTDVDPYCNQLLRSALDHKERNDFIVLIFNQVVYRFAKYLVADVILTSCKQQSLHLQFITS